MEEEYDYDDFLSRWEASDQPKYHAGDVLRLYCRGRLVVRVLEVLSSSGEGVVLVIEVVRKPRRSRLPHDDRPLVLKLWDWRDNEYNLRGVSQALGDKIEAARSSRIVEQELLKYCATDDAVAYTKWKQCKSLSSYHRNDHPGTIPEYSMTNESDLSTNPGKCVVACSCEQDTTYRKERRALQYLSHLQGVHLPRVYEYKVSLRIWPEGVTSREQLGKFPRHFYVQGLIEEFIDGEMLYSVIQDRSHALHSRYYEYPDRMVELYKILDGFVGFQRHPPTRDKVRWSLFIQVLDDVIITQDVKAPGGYRLVLVDLALLIPRLSWDTQQSWDDLCWTIDDLNSKGKFEGVGKMTEILIQDEDLDYEFRYLKRKNPNRFGNKPHLYRKIIEEELPLCR